MIGACYEIMTQGQTQNQENSCKLGNIMWISCMPIGNMIGRDAYLAGQTWDMCTTNNTMRNRWQRMGLKRSNQMTHMADYSSPKRKANRYRRFQSHFSVILGVIKTVRMQLDLSVLVCGGGFITLQSQC